MYLPWPAYKLHVINHWLKKMTLYHFVWLTVWPFSHKITWFLEPGAKSLNLIEISTNFLIKLFNNQHESADTTGKQLLSEVTRFDIKWFVRLTGYTSYMCDTCHTDLIFLKSQFIYWLDSQYCSFILWILITLTHIYLDILLLIHSIFSILKIFSSLG